LSPVPQISNVPLSILSPVPQMFPSALLLAVSQIYIFPCLFRDQV
jgi:hypothetical protein